MARIKERRKVEEDARRLRDQADETMSDAFEKRAKAQVGPRVLTSDSCVLNMRCARRSNSEQLGIRRRTRAYQEAKAQKRAEVYALNEALRRAEIRWFENILNLVSVGF
jgi:hypothetical protein